MHVSSLPLERTRGPIGRKLRLPVSIVDYLADIQKPYIHTDVIAFVCLVVFIFKLKADLGGQSRMTWLMRSLLQDGILYFLVMMGFHVAMLLLAVMDKVVIFLLPVEGRILTSRYQPAALPPAMITVYVFYAFSRARGQPRPSSLIPMMVSRLVVSLRKTADASLIQVWDGDHFTTAESELPHEMMDFAGPSSSQPPFLPIPNQDSKRSSVRPGLPSPYWEA